MTNVDKAAIVFQILIDQIELIQGERGKRLLSKTIEVLKTDQKVYDLVMNKPHIEQTTIFGDLNEIVFVAATFSNEDKKIMRKVGMIREELTGSSYGKKSYYLHMYLHNLAGLNEIERARAIFQYLKYDQEFWLTENGLGLLQLCVDVIRKKN